MTKRSTSRRARSGEASVCAPRNERAARADVEALVLLAAAAQRAAREVPRQAEDPHAILGADGTGPAQVPVDQGPELRIGHLGDGGRGEQVVGAELADDLVHAREPQRQQPAQGAEGLAGGKPHAVAPLVGARLGGVDRRAGQLRVAPDLAEHLRGRGGQAVGRLEHARGDPPGELELGLRRGSRSAA